MRMRKTRTKWEFQNGMIQIGSLDSASIVESVQGHEENQAVWTMCMTPDKVKSWFKDEKFVFLTFVFWF